MIPIENSIAGRVADIHHLLPMSGLHIIGEHFLPIHFQLMALPGAILRTSEVSTATFMPSASAARSSEARFEGGVSGDTAGSAREVAEWGDPTRPLSHPACRRASTAWKSSPKMSRTRPQHHSLRHPVENPQMGSGQAERHSNQLRVPRPQPSGRALQSPRRVRHQRHQHDEAGKLHARRRIPRHAVLRRGRRPSRGYQPEARIGRTRVFLARNAEFSACTRQIHSAKR